MENHHSNKKDRVPCQDCICLAICKNLDTSNKNSGQFLTKLCSKCSILMSYLRLFNLGLDVFDCPVDADDEERKTWNIPISRRIVMLSNYMNWTFTDSDYYKEKVNEQ